MAVYAIGDIQGCFSSLQRLLEKIKFNDACDVLWLTGDLVNRGPQSLETVRFIKSLANSAIAVLGNHDLHFLAVHSGHHRCRPDDTLDALLTAPDVDELANWLRQQPLVYSDTRLKTLMSHAGSYPHWTRAQLCQYASEVEQQLKSDDYGSFLASIYGALPDIWSEQLSSTARYRFIINALTRMRFCNIAGRLNLTKKGPPENDGEWFPWYQHPELKCNDWRIVFGHWSALGYQQLDNIISLDSGCVWGRQLTAVRLDTEHLAPYWQTACVDCA